MSTLMLLLAKVLKIFAAIPGLSGMPFNVIFASFSDEVIPVTTSFSILLMFYLGYLSIWQTMNFSDKIGDLSSWLCIVGSIFALLSRYAVFFWDQGLHQGPSLSLDKEENIDNVFYFPLIICIIGFVFLFLTLLLIRIKTEIQKRKLNILLNTRDG